jgi:hypothetical protein
MANLKKDSIVCHTSDQSTRLVVVDIGKDATGREFVVVRNEATMTLLNFDERDLTLMEPAKEPAKTEASLTDPKPPVK